MNPTYFGIINIDIFGINLISFKIIYLT